MQIRKTETVVALLIGTLLWPVSAQAQIVASTDDVSTISRTLGVMGYKPTIDGKAVDFFSASPDVATLQRAITTVESDSGATKEQADVLQCAFAR